MKPQKLTSMSILGAGSWGTALALYLARRGYPIYLWSVNNAEITALLADKENTQFLPGFQFPELIQPTADLAEAASQTDIIIAVPSVGFRQTLILLKPLITPTTRIISATKGLDEKTGQLLHESVEEILGKNHPFALLSGPSFAKEVAAGLPTALTIASRFPELRQDIAARFHSSHFQIEPIDDVIGAEIGGVVKNVIAIATGMSDGMALGANARSVIITRGLNEMTRLGISMGATAATFSGLTGLGDLILTCTDNQSRNRRLGLALGLGKDIAQAEQEIGQIVEGKHNARLISMLAKRYHVELPICEMVWEILQGKRQLKEIGHQLLSANPS